MPQGSDFVYRKSKKGFTLVELIVVIAIIAIIAGLSVPLVTGRVGKAQAAACATNRKEAMDFLRLDEALKDAGKLSDSEIRSLITDYVDERYGGLDELCPAGEVCYIEKTGAGDSIDDYELICPKHTAMP